jgi:hypothetical protein
MSSKKRENYFMHLDLDHFPPIYSQAHVPDCISCALAALVGYVDHFCPSRLFLNYNQSHDHVPSCVDGLRIYGVCSEEMWPYSKDPTSKPSISCYEQARSHRMIGRWLDCNVESLCNCLDNGLPFIFGFNIYHNFKPNAQGLIPMPEGDPKGRHAMCCVGYSHRLQAFLCRNSWGIEFGVRGYCYMPFVYVCSEDADFFFTSDQT